MWLGWPLYFGSQFSIILCCSFLPWGHRVTQMSLKIAKFSQNAIFLNIKFREGFILPWTYLFRVCINLEAQILIILDNFTYCRQFSKFYIMKYFNMHMLMLVITFEAIKCSQRCMLNIYSYTGKNKFCICLINFFIWYLKYLPGLLATPPRGPSVY